MYKKEELDLSEDERKTVNNIGRLKKCKICGKEFYVFGEYAYKKVKQKKLCFYCSWSCFRKDNKKKGRKKYR